MYPCSTRETSVHWGILGAPCRTPARSHQGDSSYLGRRSNFTNSQNIAHSSATSSMTLQFWSSPLAPAHSGMLVSCVSSTLRYLLQNDHETRTHLAGTFSGLVPHSDTGDKQLPGFHFLKPIKSPRGLSDFTDLLCCLGQR